MLATIVKAAISAEKGENSIRVIGKQTWNQAAACNNIQINREKYENKVFVTVFSLKAFENYCVVTIGTIFPMLHDNYEELPYDED